MEKVKDSIRPLIDKYKKFFDKQSIQEFKIVLETTHEGGDRHLYEIHASIKTAFDFFHITKSGWDILSTIDEVVNKLERELLEKKERLKDERKSPDNA